MTSSSNDKIEMGDSLPSKEELMEKYKQALNIAQKAKNARDEAIKDNKVIIVENENLREKIKTLEKQYGTAEEMLAALTEQKLKLAVEIDDPKKQKAQFIHDLESKENAEIEAESFKRQYNRLLKENEDLITKFGSTEPECHKEDEPLGCSGSSGMTKKQRKARTVFTDHQFKTLEKSFERQKYLSIQDRMELAAKLSLSDTQVKTWYQKRRTKWKRPTAVGLEQLAEAGNYAAFQQLDGAPPYRVWPGYPGAPPAAGPADLYYRQVAAASLQKPLAYRLYPGVAGPSALPPGLLPPTSYYPPPRSPTPPPSPPDSRAESVDVEESSPPGSPALLV